MNKEEKAKLVQRINELAAKKKAGELTAAEVEERKELHQIFLKDFRAGFRQTVENIKLVDEHGNDVTSEKAKAAQREKGLRQD
ncbi:hypothetical protein FC62_GL000085 [Amylolactobacillus amylotrophicus DSM 20534]|uniref:Uncharacterized protein n=3 Tax=Amylolactobacillus TaxID=2767876 RepID=A0A1L6XA88_9LACO|nr:MULTISPECIES: DUF896 domain-containing protein [Amylolactobacillus]APT17891.1 hypothetical protein LA20533_00500 [Amylolactobacillus amylophilus DSM 20533 = JCM 1125]KRK38402.1 hypothetical protein FC62_GL000085 [Amylolactobacillus amylotrophicus DSM 20534]KRM42955.1 hypothetical protein FD40_GL000754 [Amylolactobacillus amylophilus DSM 20533 = JCM 1125]GED79822.1 UPF0291 protein [Amylolactobacillus amylophilus]